MCLEAEDLNYRAVNIFHKLLFQVQRQKGRVRERERQKRGLDECERGTTI